jgi:hypothetical protein
MFISLSKKLFIFLQGLFKGRGKFRVNEFIDFYFPRKIKYCNRPNITLYDFCRNTSFELLLHFGRPIGAIAKKFDFNKILHGYYVMLSEEMYCFFHLNSPGATP